MRNFSLYNSELLQPISDLHLDSIDIKYAQRSDPILSDILRLRETRKKPPQTTHFRDQHSKTSFVNGMRCILILMVFFAEKQVNTRKLFANEY